MRHQNENKSELGLMNNASSHVHPCNPPRSWNTRNHAYSSQSRHEKSCQRTSCLRAPPHNEDAHLSTISPAQRASNLLVSALVLNMPEW